MFSKLSVLLAMCLVVGTNGESEAKSNVAFVIDDTTSMTDEIEQVIEKTEQLFTFIYTSKTSLIGDFILITFNDIEEHHKGKFFDNYNLKPIRVRTITSNYNEFISRLKEIKPSGGGRCPELCIEGIKTAVEKSYPNSFIFVFTDATAKDYSLGKVVEELAIQKSIRITFLLTGNCKEKDEAPGYIVYRNLAKATSGEVFELTKRDINEIMDYIIYIMTSPKTPLLTVRLEPGKNRFKIPTDADTKNVTIIVNVKQNTRVNLSVTGPNNEETPGTNLVNLQNTKVLAIQNPGNGPLVATVDAASPGEASVKASVTVDFKHGFSILQPNSLKSTKTSPVPGEESHLAIQLICTGDIDAKLKIIQILDINDKELISMTADVTNDIDKFYVTAHFKPPTDIFKIAIIAIDPITGNEFKRIVHNPIKVQPHPTGTLEYKHPQVQIERGPKINVKYGDSIILQCKVIGYPRPNIVWEDRETGIVLPSQAAILKLPDEYISNLKIENVNKIGSYTCKATSDRNDLVTDIIEVETYRPRFLKVLEGPKDTSIDYKQTGEVYCKIDAWPTVNIAWYKNDRELANNVDFIISDDKSTLTIPNMRPELEGIYFCKAANNYNSINLDFNIKLSGETPIIDKIKHTITVEKGAKAGIPCRIIKGSPIPTITWEFKQNDTMKFTSLASTEEIIQLDPVELNNAGTYKCHAKNIIGEDFFEVFVDVQCIPKIDKSKSNVIANQGSKVIIPCRITEGNPTPDITWEFKRKDTIDFLSTSETKLEVQIDSADVKNAGVYRCRAKNVIGEDSHETELTVQYGPIIDKTETSKTIKEGSQADIPCRILRGFPTPVITWEFKRKSSNQFINLAETGQMIHLNTVTLQNAGVYKCLAKNFVGKDDYEFVLDVHCLPVLDKSKSINVVKQGSNIIMSCRIKKGVPEPDIRWEFKEEGTTDFVSLSETEQDLKISAVDMENAGLYRCVAKNIIGEDSLDINLIVQHIPVIDKSTTVKIAVEGSKATLTCRILKGNPSPHITWEFKRKSATEFVSLTENVPEIDIAPIELESAGTYKCHAKNTVGQAFHETELIVQNTPNVVVNPPVTVKIGEVVTLSCEVTGAPDPDVRWTKDGITIAANLKYQIFKDNSLRFVTSIADKGNYTCEAKNTIGSDAKNATLDVYGPVTIDPPIESKIDTDVGSDVELICEASGIPAPNITWNFFSLNPNVGSQSFPSQETLTIKGIQADSAGYYTCEADNGYDNKSMTYEIVVNVPVEIEHPAQTEFNVVENDFVVMIPCKTKGYPKPKISWTKDFEVLPMGDTYAVNSDGTLIIKNPLISNGGNYLCIADNEITNAFQMFTVNVTPYPIENGPTETIYVEENTWSEIKCKLPYTSHDKVRWYTKGHQIPLSGNELILRGAAVSDSGEYTCRVNSFLGSQSAHVKIEVGLPPSFSYEKNSIITVPFIYGRNVRLECYVTGTPQPTVTWWHNGTKLTESSMEYRIVMRESHIGENRCEAKNNFGTVSRTFVIKITGCTINYAEKELKRYHPILFSSSGRLAEFPNQDGIMTIPEDEPIDIMCPNGVRQGYCSKHEFIITTNTIAKRHFKYADLKCDAEVELRIESHNRIIKCSSDPESRLFQVGYQNQNMFYGIYDVCMIQRSQKILFVKHNVHRYASNIKLDSHPFDDRHMYYSYKDMFECHKQKYDHFFNNGCCFLGRQLVAPEDVSPGIQKSTYINMNVLPEWNLCGDNRNLDEINKRIRELAKSIPNDYDLEVYSGEFKSQNFILRDYRGNKKVTSKYLWKVVQVRSVSQALAIVTINMPNLKQNEAVNKVFCSDICSLVDWMQNADWHDVNKGYTFCCEPWDFAKNVSKLYMNLFNKNIIRNKNLN